MKIILLIIFNNETYNSRQNFSDYGITKFMCVLKVKYIIIIANTALFQIRLQPIGDCEDWTVSYCSLVYFRVVLCVTSTCIVCNAHM